MLNKQIRFYLYYFMVFLLSLGSCYVFHYLTKKQSVDYIYTEKRILSVLSSFLNIFVLYYHFTHAPHPKLLILRRRRICIYIHIFSGVLELTTCWISYLTHSERFAIIASLAAILGHIPTAYYQTSIVFGTKAVMIPGYLFTISLHLFCALNLLLTPSSVYWLLNMFLTHNVYVWVRVFYYVFNKTGILKDTLYSNSVLASGLTVFPVVLGASGNLLFLAYSAINFVLYFAIVQPDEEDRRRFRNESTRDLLVNKAAHQAWINEQERLTKMDANDQLTDRQRAHQVFDRLCANQNGAIDTTELARLLHEWEASSIFIEKFVNLSRNRQMTFDFFYRNIWRLSKISTDYVEHEQKLQSEAKARFVFDQLDTDSSGFIDAIELHKLLIQWGLPDSEVNAYLVNDEDKQFSFEEFYRNLKPIWNFAYQHMTVYDAGHVIQKPDEKVNIDY